MNTINFDRVQKLLARLGAAEEKRTNINSECDELLAQIQAELTGAPASRMVTMPTNKVKGKGSLGDAILKFIAANPTKNTIEAIADGLKCAPNRVALSLYHLGNAGKAFKQGDSYYPAMQVGKVHPPTLDQNYEKG